MLKLSSRFIKHIKNYGCINIIKQTAFPIIKRNVFTQIKEFPKITAQPIDKHEFGKAMEKISHHVPIFETKFETFGIAVSGGSDSIALALLVNEWCKNHNKRVIAITVDHNLRPESKEEALTVKQILNSFGITTYIYTINWEEGQPPVETCELQARIKRNQIFKEACEQHNISMLFTAHQAMDNVETFIYRLALGSGTIGLASIPVVVKNLNSVPIGRPLLEFKKERLQATCIQHNVKWIEDPMNQCQLHFRTKIRTALKSWEEHGIETDKLFPIVDHIKQIRNIMVDDLEDFFTKYVHYDMDFGFGTINRAAFWKLNTYKAVRVLAYVCQFVRNAHYTPRMRAIIRAIQGIKERPFTKQTFGGCIIQQTPQIIYVVRENVAGNHFKRQISTTMKFGDTILFDDRFRIYIEQYNKKQDLDLLIRSLNKSNHKQKERFGPAIVQEWFKNTRIPKYNGYVDTNPDSVLTVSTFSTKSWSQLARIDKRVVSKYHKDKIPHLIRMSLPVIEDEKGILAVPYMNYYRQRDVYVKCTFEPKHPPLLPLVNCY